MQTSDVVADARALLSLTDPARCAVAYDHDRGVWVQVADARRASKPSIMNALAALPLPPLSDSDCDWRAEEDRLRWEWQHAKAKAREFAQDAYERHLEDPPGGARAARVLNRLDYLTPAQLTVFLRTLSRDERFAYVPGPAPLSELVPGARAAEGASVAATALRDAHRAGGGSLSSTALYRRLEALGFRRSRRAGGYVFVGVALMPRM